jgi:hypothetical protein
MHRSILMAIALLSLCAGARAEAPTEQIDAIRIDVPALTGLARYEDLLAHPAYLALALDSSGMASGLAGRLTIIDSRALKLQNAFMRFKERKGAIYSYEAGYTLDLGAGTTDLKFPVTIDITQLPQGKVTIKATPPLAKLFPKELVERARIKAEALSDRGSQQTLLSYLDKLARDAASTPAADSLFDAILIDAYNKGGSGAGRSGQPGCDAGDAQTVWEQRYLIATLVIWLIIVPGWLFWRRIRRARAKPV